MLKNVFKENSHFWQVSKNPKFDFDKNVYLKFVSVAKLDLKDEKIRKALLKGLKKEQSKDVPKKNKEHSQVEILRKNFGGGQKVYFW